MEVITYYSHPCTGLNIWGKISHHIFTTKLGTPHAIGALNPCHSPINVTAPLMSQPHQRHRPINVTVQSTPATQWRSPVQFSWVLKRFVNCVGGSDIWATAAAHAAFSVSDSFLKGWRAWFFFPDVFAFPVEGKNERKNCSRGCHLLPSKNKEICDICAGVQ